jgi:hypothetical protein
MLCKHDVESHTTEPVPTITLSSILKSERAIKVMDQLILDAFSVFLKAFESGQKQA